MDTLLLGMAEAELDDSAEDWSSELSDDKSPPPPLEYIVRNDSDSKDTEDVEMTGLSKRSVGKWFEALSNK